MLFDIIQKLKDIEDIENFQKLTINKFTILMLLDKDNLQKAMFPGQSLPFDVTALHRSIPVRTSTNIHRHRDPYICQKILMYRQITKKHDTKKHDTMIQISYITSCS